MKARPGFTVPLAFCLAACLVHGLAQPTAATIPTTTTTTTTTSTTSAPVSAARPAVGSSPGKDKDVVIIAASTSSEDLSDDESESFVARTVSINATNSTEDEDEEEYEESEVCEATLGSFVRNYNVSQVLPDDFYQLEEKMLTSDIYAERITHINQTIEIANRLLKYATKLQGNKDLQDTIFYLSSTMMDRLYQARLSPECSAALVRIGSGIRGREVWAARFVDSFGHVLPSGVLRGHLSSFGEFDECVRTKSPPNDKGERVYGKHCQLQFRSIFPPLEDYNPMFEDIIRAHPYYAQVANLTRAAKMDNYLKFSMGRVASEGMEALSHSMYFYGVCFPHVCSTTDIASLFNTLFYPITKIPFTVQEHMCTAHQDVQEVKLDTQQKVAIVSLTTLAIIVLMCSAYHYYLICQHNARQHRLDRILATEKNNNNNAGDSDGGEKCYASNGQSKLNAQLGTPTLPPPHYNISQQFVLAFSAIKNTEKLLYHQNRYAVIDTIRFTLTVFVFGVQSINFGIMLSLQLMRSIMDTVPGEMVDSNAYWFARAPGFLIDGFVFTLGFMLIISQFGRLKRAGGNFSYLTYVWKRWIRLSIAMIGTFFVLFIFPLVGDGPMWFVTKQWLMPPCKSPKSIMSSFLYYSNWNGIIAEKTVHNTLPLCNPPTWFLSMSTQIYMLAPLLFLPLYHYPRMGVVLVLLVLAMSPLATTFPYWYLGYPTYMDATKFTNINDIIRSFQHYHTNTLQYFTTLSGGLLTGYLVKCKPNLRIPGGQLGERILWALAFATPVGIYAWHCTFWGWNQVVPDGSALAWQVLSKFGQCFWLGYVCYMCCTGRGGLVNKILSVSAIQPIAKLSYSIYLLRVPTILYRFLSKRHTYELYYWAWLQSVFVDYLITACLAYGLYLMFEAPSNNIMAIFEGDELYRVMRGESSEDMRRFKDNVSSVGSLSNNNNGHGGEKTGVEVFTNDAVQIQIQTVPSTNNTQQHLQVTADDDGSVSIASSSRI